jgi:radical SAM protein with 4Fe4S-binding SPASM domain
MESVSYGAFSEGINSRLSGTRTPLSGTIEVTRRCPLTCLHCYNNLPMSDAEAHRRELSYDELCRLMDDMAEAGCLWLLLTGGEIFARPDFLDIYTYAKKKGFLVTLFTNGTLVTERIADYLAAWRPFAIEITLYGHTRETYERLTGIPGSFEKCMRGIRLLRDRGLPLALKTVAVSTNRHEIPQMQAFAAELGVAFKFDSMINPRIDCSQSPLDVRLSPEECVALDLADPKRADEWVRFADEVRKSLEATPAADTVYQCGGGISAFAIDPYGRMSICVLSEAHKYDIRTGTFRDGWETFLRKERAKRVTRPTKCVSCALKSACGMCPANAELDSGDAETPVEYLCHVAHLRAHALGLEVPAHGECEYCAGGASHAHIVETAARLHADTGAIFKPKTLEARDGKLFLHVVSASTSGGCGSCSTH